MEALYVVETTHEGTAWIVRPATAAEMSDPEEADWLMSLEEARECAAESGPWFEVGTEEAP